MAVEAKLPRELEVERRQAEADIQNKQRTGKGLRIRVGQTRGKNPVVISWEQFDDSQPDTLPTTPAEFIAVVGQKTEAQITALLIDGFNSAAYTAASDPLAEYVNPAWPEDVQTQFRLILRNYSRAMEIPLEEAVAFVKPGFDKKYGS